VHSLPLVEEAAEGVADLARSVELEVEQPPLDVDESSV